MKPSYEIHLKLNTDASFCRRVLQSCETLEQVNNCVNWWLNIMENYARLIFQVKKLRRIDIELLNWEMQDWNAEYVKLVNLQKNTIISLNKKVPVDEVIVKGFC